MLAAAGSEISNLFSSVTVIFSSGVEKDSGKSPKISEIDLFDFERISAALTAAYGWDIHSLAENFH